MKNIIKKNAVLCPFLGIMSLIFVQYSFGLNAKTYTTHLVCSTYATHELSFSGRWEGQIEVLDFKNKAIVNKISHLAFFGDEKGKDWEPKLETMIQDWNPKAEFVQAIFETGLKSKATGKEMDHETHLNCRISKLVGKQGLEKVRIELGKLFASGRHDQFISKSSMTRGSDLIENLIKEYIKNKYPEDYDQFKWVQDSTQFFADERIAGTIVMSGVAQEVFRDSKTSDKALELIDYFLSEGADFGFDGWDQNGCAAPTQKLLIVLPFDQRVFGFDLNPCVE